MKLFKYLLLLMPVLCITSCVKDEASIFGESAAVRMQKAIDEYKTLLTNTPNGWIIHYYPENQYGIGAYAMYWKFSSDGNVEAACEVATNKAAYTTASSNWDVFAYSGPVLTFDTYNPVIHYFSEVTSSADRDGRAGDYDFVIMKAVKDTFYLSGLKNKNKMVMFKAPENPIDYLRQTTALQKKLAKFPGFSIYQNGDSIGSMSLSSTVTNDLLNRKLTATYSDGKKETTENRVFYYTPDGMVLQSPLEIKGESLLKFTWDDANAQYVAEGANIVFKYVGPKLYNYEDFLGDYTLKFSTSNAVTNPPNRNKSQDITLAVEQDGLTYNILGLVPDGYPGAKVIGQYVGGSFRLMGQNTGVKTSQGWDLWWLPYSENPPSNTYNYPATAPTLGVVVSDMDDSDGKLKFNMVDNKVWGGALKVAGFMFRPFSAPTTAQTAINGKSGSPGHYFLRFEQK